MISVNAACDQAACTKTPFSSPLSFSAAKPSTANWPVFNNNHKKASLINQFEKHRDLKVTQANFFLFFNGKTSESLQRFLGHGRVQGGRLIYLNVEPTPSGFLFHQLVGYVFQQFLGKRGPTCSSCARVFQPGHRESLK